MAIDKAQVEQVLEHDIRPYLRSHGGNVELVDVTHESIIKVRLSGGCASCPAAQFTITNFVEQALKAKISGIQAVKQV